LTEADELFDLYKLEVVRSRPMWRWRASTSTDEVYRTQDESTRRSWPRWSAPTSGCSPVWSAPHRSRKSELLGEYLKKHGYKRSISQRKRGWRSSTRRRARASRPKLFAVLNRALP